MPRSGTAVTVLRAAQTSAPAKTLREGSAVKRSAILAAARDLFVADGFDRTSVDDVAARAGVSKRTVYDYFGDKRTLFAAVIDQVAEVLLETLVTAMDENLANVTDLEPALIAFCIEAMRTTVGSSEYSAILRLISNEGEQLPADVGLADDSPEEALAIRFAEFGRQGLLEVPDPRLAADHFTALTLGMIVGDHGPRPARSERETRRIITEGVRAFLRAYGPR